jgi:hypothetical protein
MICAGCGLPIDHNSVGWHDKPERYHPQCINLGGLYKNGYNAAIDEVQRLFDELYNDNISLKDFERRLTKI